MLFLRLAWVHDCVCVGVCVTDSHSLTLGSPCSRFVSFIAEVSNHPTHHVLCTELNADHTDVIHL